MRDIQRSMALDFIDRLDRVVTSKVASQEGAAFNWYVPHSEKIMGSVRYNLFGGNAYHYAIYTNTHDFDNSSGLFANDHQSQSAQGWVAFVNPDNEREMRIVLRVMRGIIDRS